MTKLESAKEIIKQNGACYAINCNDCIQNKEGIIPCEYAESLALCDSEKYFKAKVDFCKEYIKENEMKFKVGDKVRWNGSTQDSNDLYMNFGMHDFLKGKKTHVISNITSSGNLKFKEDEIPYCFAPGWFDKVEEPIYEIDKKYIVTNHKEKLEDADNQRILVAYLPNATNPFVCVNKNYENQYKNGELYHVCTWSYAKPILEKEYKAYSQPKFEWVIEHRKFIDKDNGNKYTIEAIGDEFILTSNDEVFNLTQIVTKTYIYLTMQELLDKCSWLDGSVCGELISKKNS